MALAALTARDRELLDRLSQSEPLSTSEVRLLFFSGVRVCRERLVKLEAHDLLLRVYPARSNRGGRSEALWFLSPAGRRAIGAPARRPPGLSIPDLEHRRTVARFFLALIERSLARPGEGLYRWLGEQQAQQGTGASVRPDGYGRYLLPDGEVTFYLEADRATEPARRVKAKLYAYKHSLAADPHRERGNVLLVCDGRRRLANLARCAPAGPPWVWGTLDGERYELLPAHEQQRGFDELPAAPRQASRQVEDCLGRRWRRPAAV
jgi:Replication-relaxation